MFTKAITRSSSNIINWDLFVIKLVPSNNLTNVY